MTDEGSHGYHDRAPAQHDPRCRKIIVLKGGVIVEEGPHDRLMGLGGVYTELHNAQFEAKPAKAEA